MNVPSPFPNSTVTELLIWDAMTMSGVESVFVFKLPIAMATGLPAPPCEAVIEVVPAATPVANPSLAPIVATVVFEEAQATADVTSCTVPSVYVPVAV